MTLEDYALCLVLAVPGLLFLGFGALWLLGWTPREKVLIRCTQMGMITMACSIGLLCGIHLNGPSVAETVPLGTWFRVENYSFPLVLVVDRLSLAMSGLTVILLGLIASFSRRYLHRDAGFFRFFLSLYMFGLGALLVFFAGSFDLVIGGWELVGLSSVLLIGYFRERSGPAEAGLKVFAIYRFCDIGLLLGVFALYQIAHTASYAGLLAKGHLEHAWIPAALLLFAAMGKSAQVPFSGWLPLAMEGPTPSSAIFYGAISVHLGAYLLLRAQPLLDQAPWVGVAAVCIGAVTALHGTLVGRASADAKSAIGYAALTQLGLIFVEIGLGFYNVALLHIIGHSVVRTFEFLRAPSMLHEHHQMHAAAGGHLSKTGEFYEKYLPESLRLWLYRWAVDRAHMDHLLQRFAVVPLYAIAGFFHLVEARWIAGDGKPETVVRSAGVIRGIDA
ncbi:proton-conducting transporter membrane subunit [Bryobacter aggregatus]|uniref:proton-conducting transporter transmembrane domain-containing protein n=1 Tax=Bryobacter aggregatus TaxID=360054 RepID=UPI00068AA7C5|nr:proton-conducting transporter membrane subunit [Bryobacter aggregatus]